MTAFLILVALTLLDVATTLYALHKGATEVNPVLEPLFKAIGVWPALLLVKAGFLGVMWWARDATLAAYGLPVKVLPVIAVGYAGIVVWNLLQIRKQSTASKDA